MKRLAHLPATVVLLGGLATVCPAQISNFPHVQNFDTLAPPALPASWSSSQNRTPGTNDFTTGTTNPRSKPNSIGITNAAVAQSLVSPLFDFMGEIPDSLIFHVRRSATFNARMLVEASLDSGTTYTIRLGDSLANPNPTNYVRVALGLPFVLSTSPAVKFRWRTVADAGATATLRMDDISVTTEVNEDLALSALRFIPQLPGEQDSVRALAKIKNLGQQSAQNFSVELFVDANNDSLPQTSELRSSVTNSVPLAAADSIELGGHVGTLAPGSQLIIGRVVFPPDQNLSNNQRFASLNVGFRAQSIVINEIMYGPTSPEPEWVEVFNTRTDSVNVKNWLISDSSRTSRRTIATQDVKIPPGGFAVLTKNPATLLSIHPTIPSIIIGITSFPSLNNTTDAIVVYDSRAIANDSVRYSSSWGGDGGRSLERIDPLGSSTQQTNWGTTRSAARSTPGERNSLTRKDRDLAVDSLRFSLPFPHAGDSLQILVPIRNPGRETVSSFAVQLFRDTNGDSLAQPSELIGSANRSVPLLPLDSVTISFLQRNVRAGTSVYIARIEFGADEDTTNNIRLGRIIVGYPAGSVRINEIMYAPNAGVPEWVEVFNTRNDTLDLNKWLLGNRSSSLRYELTNVRLPLAPNTHLVFTKDSALFRQAYPLVTESVVQSALLPTFLWNNSGDAVALLDNRRLVMDSVFYRPTWGGSNGRSLERIDALAAANDSANWATSGDSLGATPTRRNSQVRLDNDLRLVSVSSDTIRPGENARLHIVVRNVGKLPSSTFELKLFDDLNGDSLGTSSEQFHAQTVSATLAPRESTVVAVEWTRPASGMHRVLAHINYMPDERLSNNIGFSILRVGYAERTLVINEIMFAPLTNNAEYVEFYNASDADVDVAQWNMRDRATSSGVNEFRLALSPKVVRPGEFFVLASDSSVLRLFSATTFEPRLLTIANQSSLSLNNDGDDVVLLDPSGFAIDSVSFSPAWHNPNVTDNTGRSLEKINPSLPSSVARNWTTSALAIGGTPGKPNSVFTSTLPQQSKLTITPNPFSPDGDGREDFAIIQYELPLTVSQIRIRLYDAVGRKIRTLANNEPSGSRGSIVWDGMDDDRRKARIGVYIVLLEAIDDRGGVVETAKGVVVVAAKL
jgi:hypothetical protein